MRDRQRPRLLQRASSLAEEVFYFSRSGAIERDRGMRDKLGMCATAIEEELNEGYVSGDRRTFCDSLHRAKMWAMELGFYLRFVVTMGYAPRSAIVEYLRDCDQVYRRIERIQRKLGVGGWQEGE